MSKIYVDAIFEHPIENAIIIDKLEDIEEDVIFISSNIDNILAIIRRSNNTIKVVALLKNNIPYPCIIYTNLADLKQYLLLSYEEDDLNKTYTYDADLSLEMGDLNYLLRGWSFINEINEVDNEIGFIYTKFDSEVFNNSPSFLKNKINIQSLSLHNIEDYMSPVLMKKNIEIGTTVMFYDNDNYLLKIDKYKGGESGVIRSNIENSLLYKGQKMAYRVYILLCSWSNTKIYPKYGILTAKKKYIIKKMVSGGLYNIDEFIKKINFGKIYTRYESSHGYLNMSLDIVVTQNGKKYIVSQSIGKHKIPDVEWEYNHTVVDTLNLADQDYSDFEPLQLLLIEYANESQLEGLFKIANIPGTMERIRHGEKWDMEYLRDLQRQSKSDASTFLPPERKYYHWLVIDEGIVVGYISIRPMNNSYRLGDGEQQIRIFIYPMGKGYGFRTIKSLLVSYKYLVRKFRLWSVVDVSNQPMNNLMNKLKWTNRGVEKHYGSSLNFYSINM